MAIKFTTTSKTLLPRNLIGATASIFLLLLLGKGNMAIIMTLHEFLGSSGKMLPVIEGEKCKNGYHFCNYQGLSTHLGGCLGPPCWGLPLPPP